MVAEIIQNPKAIRDDGTVPFLQPQPGVTPTASTHLTTKAYVDAAVTTAILASVYPVGAIFISTVSTNPSTLFGFGTWVAFGAGRVLVGLDSGDAAFDTDEETGGAKTVSAAGSVAAPTISGSTASESSHTHDVTPASADEGTLHEGGGFFYAQTGDVTTSAGSSHSHGAGTLAASAPAFTGSPTSVVQPYIVARFWKRTA